MAYCLDNSAEYFAIFSQEYRTIGLETVRVSARSGGSLRSRKGHDFAPRDRDVAGPVASERRGARAPAEVEHEAVGRAATHSEQPRVQAALVVEGAERDAVARRVGATGGAERDVMVV